MLFFKPSQKVFKVAKTTWKSVQSDKNDFEKCEIELLQIK